jgi:hypothetical protein
MIRKLAVRTFLCLFWLLAIGHVAVTPVAAQTMTKATPVSIDEADRILRARMPSKASPSAAAPGVATAAVPGILAAGTAGCTSGSTQPVEIVTLAASLKCDLDLIFEYVYNNIEYEPLFGSNKGALGTLLDQRGNDIDQAQLFVALLNAAGITQTNFIYGYITVTGTTTPLFPCTATWIAPAPGWLGVKNDVFAILNTIANGGIPTGSGVYNGDGTLSCLDVAHVWVQVTIAGTNYVFDPSFKQHVVSTGLANLGSILGYNQSQFLTDAGGTIGSDSSISSINRTKVLHAQSGYRRQDDCPVDRIADPTNQPSVSFEQPTVRFSAELECRRSGRIPGLLHDIDAGRDANTMRRRFQSNGSIIRRSNLRPTDHYLLRARPSRTRQFYPNFACQRRRPVERAGYRDLGRPRRDMECFSLHLASIYLSRLQRMPVYPVYPRQSSRDQVRRFLSC